MFVDFSLTIFYNRFSFSAQTFIHLHPVWIYCFFILYSKADQLTEEKRAGILKRFTGLYSKKCNIRLMYVKHAVNVRYKTYF